MSGIVIGKSGNRNIGIDLAILLVTRLLIQADSGGGKTYLLRLLAEQLFGKVPVIIIDPEGEFATLREKFGYLLVGKDGDTPADPRSAALLAQKLLEFKASAVCDLYEMKPSQRHEWVRLFLDSMIDAPKKLWHPTIVVVDEAHMFCPEKGKGESVASESMIALCTRGRKRGYCAVWATQRLATLNKDATSMLLNRLIGPTFEDVNRKRAADVLGVLDSDKKEFFKSIQTLDPGNFYAIGRAISRERILVKIGSVTTTHQELGAKHDTVPPPPPESIIKLLPKLADLPKTAEEKAKTEAQLRVEIRELKTQLRTQPKPAVDNSEKICELEQLVKALTVYAGKTENFIADQASAMGNAVSILEKMVKIQPPDPDLRKVAKIIPKHIPAGVSFVNAKPFTPQNRPKPAPASPIAPNGDVSLRPGALRMLSAAAMYYPNGITEGQMAAQAGVKRSGGSFSSYKSNLRTNGFLVEKNGLLQATDDGMAHLGEAPASPSTTAEVLSVWRPKLRPGAQRMLDVLIEAQGEPVSHEELGERSGVSDAGGSFSSYLSNLRTAGLVVDSGKRMSAANKETLFL